MMLQKTKLTSRRFYNKWLYKVSLRLTGCGILRYKSLDHIKDYITNAQPDDRPYTMYAKALQNRDQIFNLCSFLEKYDAKEWTKRIENNAIDLYTNDKNFYESLSTEFKESLIHRFEPDPLTINLLTDSHSAVSVKKLPHNRYRYRVYLLPHKMAGDKEGKQKYIDWVRRQEPKVTCTEAVQRWFLNTDWNWDRRYILVEDESTLLMLKLRNSEVIGRIYNYIVSDK